ncbi:glycosyltransferase family 2 protein [Pedobacter punctiformis]|uniref:Glycosyltransferase family 2 protein n=1 Tax=Pedobacter punctiformis TaxID=3004097 RepID=A0ABT4LA31_9SPHI|nr:glycosyltransferase family 2 protein [Pedobacter sp. HCMS5-2]MCZ4244706.1 glycosyltransferase family 2 protein [Pedobacter sp. HCMS5-2]
MKISICIPQYNRIQYLKISLLKIAEQKEAEIEIVISDDASTDDTSLQIEELKKTYPFPINYFRFESNQGYDRNLRKSLELASGDYCFILGNDDTLIDDKVINRLTKFIQENNYPDIGFCNSADYLNIDDAQIRAQQTANIGTGANIALKYYSSFSFVAGLIFKKSAFDSVNTSKLDGSIYVQIYLATLIIIRGGYLFTIKEPLILKDIRVNNEKANSYLDTLPRTKSEYKVLDAGLPSYANVCAMAFKDAGLNETEYYFKIIKRIYQFTYPFWLLDYRKHSALIASRGLREGLKLKHFKNHELFSVTDKLKLKGYYMVSSFLGLNMPLSLFEKLKKSLYNIAKS